MNGHDHLQGDRERRRRDEEEWMLPELRVSLGHPPDPHGLWDDFYAPRPDETPPAPRGWIARLVARLRRTR